MRVVVNRLAAVGNKTGIGHYTAELLRGLAAQAGPDVIDVFPTGWLWHARRLWVRLKPGDAGEVSPPSTTAAQPGLRAWVKGTLLGAGKRWGGALNARDERRALAGCDLYHEPNLIPLPCDRPTVATLHDLSAFRHPEWHPPKRVAYFERHLPRTLTQCCHFITISEFSKREIVRHFGVAPERITVTYMGTRAHLRPLPGAAVERVRRRLGLPPRYLLHVGTVEPRKNLDMLVRAYRTLPPPLRERCPLVLVGGVGWNAGALADYLRGPAAARDGVLHLGYVAESDLAGLYAGARALVLPSFYEGFGMPAAEMLACGGAVLTSTAEALAEVAGARAALVDPRDEPGWADALHRLISDDGWRDELRRDAVPRARPFTWQRCAADTLGAYRAALAAASTRRAA